MTNGFALLNREALKRPRGFAVRFRIVNPPRTPEAGRVIGSELLWVNRSAPALCRPREGGLRVGVGP
jgi:hypothetical protein